MKFFSCKWIFLKGDETYFEMELISREREETFFSGDEIIFKWDENNFYGDENIFWKWNIFSSEWKFTQEMKLFKSWDDTFFLSVIKIFEEIIILLGDKFFSGDETYLKKRWNLGKIIKNFSKRILTLFLIRELKSSKCRFMS